MTKQCTVCGEEKPTSCFYFQRGKCKPCQNKVSAKYKDSEKNRLGTAAWRARCAPAIKQRKLANRFLLDCSKARPCSDCKQSFPSVAMDYDHVGNKTRNVSQMAQYRPSRLFAEIAECELVCAVCHRLRTASRLTGGF